MFVYFRYNSKIGSFWRICSEERRCRSRWGRSIPNVALHVFSMRDLFIANAFLVIKLYWKGIKLLCGCGVEHPMMFTYYSR